MNAPFLKSKNWFLSWKRAQYCEFEPLKEVLHKRVEWSSCYIEGSEAVACKYNMSAGLTLW